MTGMEALKKIFSECEDLEIQVSSSEILPTHRFREDLGMDSLGLMTLAYELQEYFPELDETSIANWNTLQDCLSTLQLGHEES